MRRWILIGVVVVVVIFAVWWFSPTVVPIDCSDVEKNETEQADVYTIVSEADNLPLLQDWGPNAGLRYHFYYENPGHTALLTDYFTSLEALKDGLDTLNIASEDKRLTKMIIGCIEAGCPSCK